MIFCEEVPVKY